MLVLFASREVRSVLATIALLVFPLLMAFAASSDLLTMRISNVLVLLLVASFFLLAVMTGMPWDQMLMHLAAAGLVLAAAFACFAFGWVGGGDAKLAAATALWLGFGLTLPYLVYTALLGGALTLAILALRRFPLPPVAMNWTWLARLHDHKVGVPYGIALAAAGLITYSQTSIFHQLIG